MHRYIPRFHIVQATDSYSIRTGPLSTYIFQETAFIAVTAYQNEKVTKWQERKDQTMDFYLSCRLPS